MLNNTHLALLPEQQAKTYGEKTVLIYRDYDLGKWLPVSWNEFAEKAAAVSRALLALGVERGERIAVFSQNKPECLFTSFGGYGVRAVTIPFYATSSGAQVAYMMNDGEVRLLFVGEQSQYDTAISTASQCHQLQHIIIFDSRVQRRDDDRLSMTYDEFLQLGTAQYADELAQRKGEASFDDIADILYTSGTTGNSKGVILTYKMYHAAFQGNDATLPIETSDIIMNFLPYTHVFERGWSYLCLCEGAQLAVNLKPQDVVKSLQEVRPMCMASVPRFWEKVYQGVQEKIASSGAVQRKVMQTALDVGIRYWRDYASRGLAAPMGLRMKYKLYDRTVYPLLRKTLGLERGKFFPTAGAAVSPEVETFAHAVGIYMMVGYGLTESTATVSNDNMDKPATIGSIGRPMPGVEVKISDEGEILLKGDTITPGYYKKPNATREAFTADGWFRTGDAGYMQNGELFLKERIKDLYKTSNGKYIAPQIIEAKLAVDRFVEQCVVVADKRKFVTALIVPDYRALEEFCMKEGIIYGSREELCKHPRVHKMLAERLSTLQQDLAPYEQVKHFLLLPEPFTMDNGELTNTLKVRRNVVVERYAKEIDEMYAEAERNFAH